MTDFLDRAAAPLTDEEWERLDATVTSTAKQHLVGRRFIPVFGPFGVGLQTIQHDIFQGATATQIDMTGDSEGDILGTGRRDYRRLPIIYKDFQVHWRDLETHRQLGMPFDTSLAAAAAAFVANFEDQLIFNGDPRIETEGLLTASGRQTVASGDWSEPGSIFSAVVAAAEKLTSAGFYGPYALVLSPKLYAQATRVYANTGVLEIDQIKKIADGGVFRSAVVEDERAVMVSTGPQNMDLAISQDLITAYLDTDNMNHVFRVLEILALRIKRPGAICTFE